jgi:hypothetical protein
MEFKVDCPELTHLPGSVAAINCTCLSMHDLHSPQNLNRYP